MDSYKAVVMEYIRGDSAVFVNTDCSRAWNRANVLETRGFRWSCDAIVVDFRHRAVYLCEIALSRGLRSLIKRLGLWTKNWEEIKTGLHCRCQLPSKWRVYVWLFVPRDSFEILDAALEELRTTLGSAFKVKITALEDVQPWQAGIWNTAASELEDLESRSVHIEQVQTERLFPKPRTLSDRSTDP